MIPVLQRMTASMPLAISHVWARKCRGDGRWQYKLLFANKTTVPQNVYHFILWYDKDGKLITTPSPVWMSCVVLTGEYKEIRIVAPTREVRDFRLYLYGAQWRDWIAPDGRHIDQIRNLIEGIRNDPFGRRHIVSAWNPGELDKMALPPCHALFQFHVSADRGLSCQLYQRSCDLFLGVPFNIASYALLTMMVAQVCGLKPKEFIHTYEDLHIYKNHIEQVKEQLGRIPRALPTMTLNPDVNDIGDFKYEDFKMEGYDPYPAIKAPIAV